QVGRASRNHRLRLHTVLYFTYGHRRYVSPNMDCNFVISDPNRTSGSLYMIENANEVDFNHYIMITRTSSLTAHFLTRSLTYLNLHGYCLKFTPIHRLPPPGWTSLGDVLHLVVGSGQRRGLQGGATSANAKCNNMRSNLLTLPLLQRAGIRSVKELAERRLAFPHPVWIGLTDNTTAGPGKALTGLNGTPLDMATRCRATLFCAMPSGGTDEFFPIPSGQRPPSKLQLLWLLLLVPLSAGFIALCLQARRRRQNYQAIGANVEPSGDESLPAHGPIPPSSQAPQAQLICRPRGLIPPSILSIN
uniref:US8A n=1 Tax=Macrostomum lignano TaxID=282301 RepID=A0A1I8JNM8_9PLAT